MLAIGIILLGLKQTSYVRNMPEIILNILNLVMKESVGIGLVMGVVIVSESKKLVKVKEVLIKILTPIGFSSYERYLVHGYALGIFNLGYSKWLLVAMFIGISVVGSAMLYIIDKKVSTYFRKSLLMVR